VHANELHNIDGVYAAMSEAIHRIWSGIINVIVPPEEGPEKEPPQAETETDILRDERLPGGRGERRQPPPMRPIGDDPLRDPSFQPRAPQPPTGSGLYGMGDRDLYGDLPRMYVACSYFVTPVQPLLHTTQCLSF